MNAEAVCRPHVCETAGSKTDSNKGGKRGELQHGRTIGAIGSVGIYVVPLALIVKQRPAVD